METKTIPLWAIVENTWNPNIMPEKKFVLLTQHIQHRGMVQPILVRPFTPIEQQKFAEREVIPEYQIIDGAHRYRATNKAGLTEITCVVITCTEEEAKILTVSMNNIKGSMQDIPLATLIEELHKNNTLEFLTKELAYEERELKNFLRLLETPQDFSKLVQTPEQIPMTMTFIVWPDQEKTIKIALEKTGKQNKADALSTICKTFLEKA